jgi:hypothetical protein
MVQKLSGQRILNELALIFEETSYAATVNDLCSHGVVPVKRTELKLMPSSSKHAFYFLLSKLPKNSITLNSETKRIVDDFRSIGSTMTKLSKASKRSVIYSILNPVTEELVEAIELLKPELAGKISTFQKLTRIKPFITGKDLKKYNIKPQKQYAKLLNKLFTLQLDKKLKSRKAAIAYLKTIKKK